MDRGPLRSRTSRIQLRLAGGNDSVAYSAPITHTADPPNSGRRASRRAVKRVAISDITDGPRELFLGTNANNPHLHPVLPDSSRNGAATGVGSGPAVASLDAVIGGQKPAGGDVAPGSRDTEDELFALPMSPRSPEMTTSPFSLLK